YFFFQAEDGIRDATVTGVQTCALPIFVNDQLAWYLPRSLGGAALVSPLQNAFGILFPWVLLTPLIVVQAVRALRGRGGERDTVRSEERRVGKEWRCGW